MPVPHASNHAPRQRKAQISPPARHKPYPTNALCAVLSNRTTRHARMCSGQQSMVPEINIHAKDNHLKMKEGRSDRPEFAILNWRWRHFAGGMTGMMQQNQKYDLSGMECNTTFCREVPASCQSHEMNVLIDTVHRCCEPASGPTTSGLSCEQTIINTNVLPQQRLFGQKTTQWFSNIVVQRNPQTQADRRYVPLLKKQASVSVSAYYVSH